MFFDESVKGLNVGAPVLFQGVQVGSVTSIEIHADFANLKTQIPVIIEIEPDKFHAEEQEARKGQSRAQQKKVATKLIEKGLRAQLGMQSLITGQLVVELDFFPESNVCFPPAKIDEAYKDIIMIPTCKSTSAKLADALEKLDLQKLEKHLESTLAGIDKLVNTPDLTGSIKAARPRPRRTA